MKALALKPIRCVASDARLLDRWDDFDVEYGVGYEGDLVIVESLSSHGAYSEVETMSGRSMKLFERQRFVGVLGNRESSKYLVGGVPTAGLDISSATILHLLTNGGIVGVCEFSPRYMGDAMPLKCLGLLHHNGERLNTVARTPYIEGELGATCPIILVAATGTDAGKTTLTSKLIHHLTVHQRSNVASAKLAGTGCLEDVLMHQDAGAKWTLDFPDVGLPSTYTSPARYLSAVRTLLHKLSLNRPDLIVGELGGDLIWANIPTLLKAGDIMSNVTGLVLIIQDVIGAVGAIQLFKEWKVRCPVYLVTSPFRNSLASHRRIKQYLGMNSYDMNSEFEFGNLLTALCADLGLSGS